jgi:hypothetical protein
VLYRALRPDVSPRLVAFGGPDGRSYEVLDEDGDPDGAGGVLLIAPGDEPDFAQRWERARATLAGCQGYLGARLCRAGADFVGIVRWSSPLMHARALRRDDAPELPGSPALYLRV